MMRLTCDGLCVHAGARALVHDLTLQIDAGQRWVVLGPNGAGKSTLLAVLAGVRTPERGSVAIDGTPLAALTVQALAQRRAVVTDRWHDPFVASVLDTVLTARYRLGRHDAAGASVAYAALADMDCADLAARDVRWLSRGERQRVAIATALAQDTALLLLDEPIAHQDPRHQGWVLQHLAAHRERTLVASMHDVNAAAALATHALLLYGDGRWLAGLAGAVLTAPHLSALFGTAFQCIAAGQASYFVAPPSG